MLHTIRNIMSSSLRC